MWLLSHVSLLVLGYHVEFLPLLLHKQFSANHTLCELLEACVISDNNNNLTSTQRELVHWLFNLCHQGFHSLQWPLGTGPLGNSPLIQSASKCDHPKCASCKYGKAKHHPIESKTQVPVPSKVFSLKKDELYPGQHVSMDHCKVTLPDHSIPPWERHNLTLHTVVDVFLLIMQWALRMWNTS